MDQFHYSLEDVQSKLSELSIIRNVRKNMDEPAIRNTSSTQVNKSIAPCGIIHMSKAVDSKILADKLQSEITDIRTKYECLKSKYIRAIGHLKQLESKLVKSDKVIADLRKHCKAANVLSHLHQ